MGYDRDTPRRLATSRLAEARILAERGEPSGAYFLAGYAVECARKARIAAQFRAHEIPDKGLVNDIYTHDLKKLLRLAGLQLELEIAIQTNVVFGQRWTIVEKWTEQARYEIWTVSDASSMIEAVTGRDDSEGLFQWLVSRW